MADARVRVYPLLSAEFRIWVKSGLFSVATLVGEAPRRYFQDGSLGIFRLSPQDYHRYHSPVRGTVIGSTLVEGTRFATGPVALQSPVSFGVA